MGMKLVLKFLGGGAHLLAKQREPFTNGKLVKLCLIAPGEKKKYPEKISLLRMTRFGVKTVAQAGPRFHLL